MQSATQSTTLFSNGLSTLKTIGGTLVSTFVNMAASMAISWVITSVIGLIDDAIHKSERLIEAGEEARSKIQEIDDAYNEKATFNSEKGERFEELRQGVDQKTNKNISLTNDEYSEYLSLCNEIATIYPSLVTSYDSQGNAILNLGNNAETAAQQLDTLLEKQKENYDYQKRQLVNDDVTGTLQEISELERELENSRQKGQYYENITNTTKDAYAKQFKEAMLKASDETLNNFSLEFSLDDDIGNIDELKKILADHGYMTYGEREQENENKRILDFMGMPDEDEIDEILTEWGANISERISDAEFDAMENKSALQGLEDQITAQYNQVLQSALTSLETSANFKEMPETIQDLLRNSMSNVDWASVIDGDYDNFNMNDFVDESILKPMVNALNSTEVETAFNRLAALDKSKLTVSEYANAVKEQLSIIESALKDVGMSDEEWTNFSVSLGFNVVDEDGRAVDFTTALRSKIEDIADTKGEDARELGLDDLTVEQLIEVEAIVDDASYGDTVADAVEKVTTETQTAINSAASTPITFASLLSEDDEGNQSTLSQSVDEFQDNISNIQSALDSLKSGDYTSSDITDLVQQFPELAGQTDNLEEALSNLKADKLSEFASVWKDAISALDEDEIPVANDFFKNLMNSIDLSGIDTSTVREQINSLFMPDTDDPAAEKNALRKIESFYDEFASELDTDVGREALFKIAADPSNAEKTLSELRALYEDFVVEIEVTASEKSIQNLNSQLALLEAQETAIQDGISQKESSGKVVSGYDYLSQINKANEQVEIYKKLIAEVTAERDKLEPDSNAWNEKQVEILGYESSIASLTQSIQEYSNAISNIPIDKLQNSLSEIQRLSDAHQRALDVKETKGLKVTADDYQLNMDYDQQQIDNLRAQKIWSQLKLASYQENSDLWLAEKENIDSLDESIASLTQDYIQNQKARDQIGINDMSDGLADLQTQAQQLQSVMEIKEAQGLKVTAKDYEDLIKNGDSQIDNLKTQNELWEQYRKELGYTADDPEWKTIQQTIDANQQSIDSMVISQAEWSDSLSNLPVTNIQALSSAIESAISEMQTVTGLTTDTMDSILTQFSDLEGMDANDVFYRTAEGIKVDTDALKDFAEAENEVVNSQFENEIENQRKAIEAYQQQIGDGRTDDTLKSMQDNLESLMDRQAQYFAEYQSQLEKLSDFENIQNAKNVENAGSHYDTMLSEIKTAKEAYDSDEVGTEYFKAVAKYLSPNGFEDAGNFAENYAKAQRYLTEDSSGVVNFLTDLEEKGYATYETLANGVKSWSLNIADAEKAAYDMGMGAEFFMDVLNKTEDYGFVNATVTSLEEGALKTEEANKELVDAYAKLAEMQASGASTDAIEQQQEVVSSLEGHIEDLTTATENYKTASATAYAEGLKNLKEQVGLLNNAREEAEESGNTQLAEGLGKEIQNLADEYGVTLIDFKIDEESYQEQLSKLYPDGIGSIEAPITPDFGDDTASAENYAAVLGKIQEAYADNDETLQNALNTLSQCDAEQLKLIQLNDGAYDFDDDDELIAAEKALDSLAAAFGLTEEQAQMLAFVMESIGATKVEPNVNFDDSQLQDGLDELTQLQENGDISVDVDFSADTSEMELDELEQRLENLQEVKVNIEPGSDAEATLDKLIGDTELQIKIRTALEETSDINELLSLDDTELMTTVGCNASEVEQVKATLESIAEGEEVPVTVHIDDSQFSQLTTSEIDITANNDAAKESADEAKEYADGLESQETISADNSPAKSKADEAKSYADSLTGTIDVNANTSGISSAISNALSGPFSINVSANVSGLPAQKYTGTMLSPAHASGTAYNVLNLRPAYANGKVALSQDEEALVNELGTESIIRDGIWSIIPGGMHVGSLKKGDIVLSAQQTKDLINSGKAFGNGKMYGSAYANGTAYNGMPAHATISTGNTIGGNKYTYSGSSNSSSSNSSSSSSSSSDKSSSKDSDEKAQTALEKFQEWFSKLFDWIEIKLERQTQKISRYIAKAESSLETGNYSTASTNYRKAIKATTTQIGYEDTASSKYEAQANKVLKKAQKQGVISSKQASGIAKKVASGKMVISEYNDEIKEVISSYQEWYDKSVDAKDAISDLQSQVREYVQALKDLRDAQRDAKLELVSSYTDVGTSTITATSGNNYSMANGQLRFSIGQLRQQNSAYASAVSGTASDTQGLGNSANKSISSALTTKDAKKKAKYNTALKNAQSAIKSGKAVSSSDSKVIAKYSQSVYSSILAYNQGLENLNTARLEEATNYAATSAEIFEDIAQTYENIDSATDNNISLYQQKAENAATAALKNGYLSAMAGQYNNLLTNDRVEINEYAVAAANSQRIMSGDSGRGTNWGNLDASGITTVTNLINAARNAANSGKEISASLLSDLAKYCGWGYISRTFYQACVDYNNALLSKAEAEAQYAIDQETVIAEKASLGTQMVSNIEQEYTNKRNENAVKTQQLQTAQDLKTTKGLSLTRKDYQDLIEQSLADQKIYNDEAAAIYSQIQSNIANGYWSTNSQEYKDAMQSYADYKNSAEECAIAQEEWNNAIVQLPYDELEKALELLDAIKDNYESLLSIDAAKGMSETADQYRQEIQNITNEIVKYTQLQADAWQDYQDALADPEGVEGGLTSDEWLAKYYEYGTSINNLTADIEELKNAIVQIPFDEFEDALELLDAVQSNFESLLSINEAKGLSETASQYKQEISNLNDQIAVYDSERAEAWSDYQQALADGGYYGGKSADEWLAEYYGYDTAVNDLTADIVDLNNAIAQLPYDVLEEALDLLESIAEYHESLSSLKSASGQDLSESDYFTQMQDNLNQISKYEELRNNAYDDYLKALASSDGAYGGLTSDEWLAKYYEYGTSINNLKSANEELKDSLRDDVYWRTYERAHDACERYADVLSGLMDLIDEEMYFDSDGNLTKYGVAQVANLVSEYENAQKEVQNYSNDIKNLNKLYAQGMYTEEEYKEKLAEFQTGLLDSAFGMKSVISELSDMYKELAQTELDSLLDLIDARQKALDKKKACVIMRISI